MNVACYCRNDSWLTMRWPAHGIAACRAIVTSSFLNIAPIGDGTGQGLIFFRLAPSHRNFQPAFPALASAAVTASHAAPDDRGQCRTARKATRV